MIESFSLERSLSFYTDMQKFADLQSKKMTDQESEFTESSEDFSLCSSPLNCSSMKMSTETLKDDLLIPPLLSAIKNKDLSTVNSLLEQGVSPHVKDEFDATALHYAVASGDHRLLSLFLKHGVDMYAKCNWNDYYVKIGQHFVRHNSDNECWKYRGTAYELAIAKNDLESLNLFIQNSLHLDTHWYAQRELEEWPPGLCDPPAFESPGYLVLEWGKLDCLKLFCSQPMFSLPNDDRIWEALTGKPNAIRNNWLSWREEKKALDKGKGQCFGWLLDQDLYRPSAEILKYELDKAYEYFPSIIKEIDQRQLNIYSQSSSSPLFEDSIDYLTLERDADAEGIPALLYAIKKGDIEIVKLFLHYGTSPFVRDHNGATALHYAVISNDPKLVSLFLDMGINMYEIAEEIKDPRWTVFETRCNNLTAYEIAIRNNAIDILKLFINRGLCLDSAWYLNLKDRALRENTPYPRSPAQLCLKFGKRELLSFLATQLDFTLPSFDQIGIDLIKQWPWYPLPYPESLIEKEKGDIEQGKVECLSWLLENKYFSIDMISIPLRKIACWEAPAIFRLLVEQDAVPFGKGDGLHDFPFWRQVAFVGPIKSLKIMLEHIKLQYLTETDNYDNPVIHDLVKDKNLFNVPTRIKMLIDFGVDINKKDKWNRTALFYARNDEMRKLLIEFGAI